MPIYERGPVRIRYEEAGAGFPMLVQPGGGLNATISRLGHAGSFDPLKEFSDTHRCVALDLRNAIGGESSGPLEVDRPWDAFADDQIGLMDHLGIDKFVVMGFCIGGPMIWNLLSKIPDRIVAAVLVHPSGFRPEMPDLFYQNNIEGWAPAFLKNRPDCTMEMVEAFLSKMYRNRGDFVLTVDRTDGGRRQQRYRREHCRSPLHRAHLRTAPDIQQGQITRRPAACGGTASARPRM